MSRPLSSRKPKLCIYCGKPVRNVRKGEHVVPEALGCNRTLRKRVCGECNKGTLSQLDQELAVKYPPLRLVAWEELSRNAPHGSICNKELNLSLEARTLPGYQSASLWPQLILEEGPPRFFVSEREEETFGHEEARRRFHDSLRSARQTLGQRNSRWRPEPVRSLPKEGRFPPRVYTCHTISDLDDKATFICKYPKYPGHADQKDILARIDAWDPFSKPSRCVRFKGTKELHRRDRYCVDPILRALVKIGINLLAYYCQHTVVSRETFPAAVAYVLGEAPLGLLEDECGPVVHGDLDHLECPKGAHKFRLSHSPRDQVWGLDGAFFGGRLGATVCFPGPNCEGWRTADVTAYVGQRNWQLETLQIILPRRVCIEWADWRRVTPSIPIGNFETSAFQRPASWTGA